MKRAVLLIVVAVLGLPHLSAQSGHANSIQHTILGTWKLVSYVREDLPTTIFLYASSHAVFTAADSVQPEGTYSLRSRPVPIAPVYVSRR